MKLKELNTVRLKHDDNERGVKTSNLGTVVDVQDNGKFLCVEFLDENNETVLEALDHYYSSEEVIKI